MGAGMQLAGLRADGTEFPAEISLSSIQTEGGAIALAAIRDVTERQRASEEISRLNRAQEEQLAQLREAQAALTHQATHDALTGLPNRVLLVDRLEQALAIARRTGHSTAVFFVDLDRFKHVNDAAGHAAGNEVLQRVAGALRSALRPMDTVARVGGDEFVAVASELISTMDAVEVGERLVAAVRQSAAAEQAATSVTASVGISVTTAGASPAETILHEADTAMYHAKSRGRDRVEFFDVALAERAAQWSAVERSIRGAIEDGRVHVHYQPLVELTGGGIVTVEALARITDADGADLPPESFIPVAEESGLIGQLGADVLRIACQEVRRWSDSGGSEPPLAVAVNLSPRQLMRDGLDTMVQDILAAARQRPQNLHLEITETALMEFTPEVIGRLERIRDLGVEIGVDDFGTGYASLTRLRRLPISFVKIDRSFVGGLGVDIEDERIVAAVVDLARGLGLRSIAEGVETGEQLAALRRFGCDEAQGFLFSRPLESARLAATLSELAARARDLVGSAI